MKNRLVKVLLAAALMACHLAASSEDIDLFLNADIATDNDVPNVLILVDNTANWNQAFTNEMAALASTLRNLPANKFRVGIMMFSETGGGNGGNEGAYVRAAIRQMNDTNKPLYQNLITSLDKIGDKSNGGKASLAMLEAYRYFSAGAPYAGNDKVKSDYTGNTAGSAQTDAVHALAGNALASKNATSYLSPIASGCQKNFIIYLSNGPAQDNSSDIATATSTLAAAGGNTATLPLLPSGSQSSVADEWAKFMKLSSLNIVTYTIDVDPGATGQAPGWTALLKSMASVSSGTYFSVSSDASGVQIRDALNNIFSEIQAVNSVFAAVSLPVSVNTQGSYLNQVFVGMFRPDADSRPRWAGNLKQYKMGYRNGELKLLDADSEGAINSQTGFITECARSFWTPTTTDNYWNFRPQGACIPAGSNADLYANSNSPDGNVVEKGAQGHTLRNDTSRTIKTCSPVFGSCTSLTDFNNANAAITSSLLGAATASERTALINWAIGYDVDNEHITDGVLPTPSGGPLTSAAVRPSVHGDIVHSRPAAINMGTDGNPKVVVFYGGNDGILRAINGNRSESIDGVPAGAELWAFAAPEFYGNFRRIRANTTLIPSPSFAGSANTKPYGFDGPLTGYKHDNGVWVYASMRRGGRVLYAFNVNPADPGDITLKWKKGCPNNFPASGTVSDADCSAGFEDIGQTWSPPKVFTAAGYAAGPLMIIGGGYDTCEDGDPHTCDAATHSKKGNKIYVMDADTGALQKTFTTERGVVDDLLVVYENGVAKYAYGADLGGNVYRINIDGAPSSWTLTRIASLGCDTVASCAANRKFMFGPDVVKEEDGVYVLTLGSGDREKPVTDYTSAYGVSNYFFMLKDKPGDADWLADEAANCGGEELICLESLRAVPVGCGSNEENDLAADNKGWYLAFEAHEQTVTSAITLFGTTTFSTHIPAVPVAGSCGSNLGTAKVYNVRYANGSASGSSCSSPVSGGGLPPSPVAGYFVNDDGTKLPFCIGCKPASPLEASEGNPGTSSSVTQPKSRIYWYTEQ